jgi:DNA-directed RNA polymerase specialized sigma24 family protein
MLRLFEELEDRVRSSARLAAVKSGIVRWADDIEQDVALELWQAISAWNGNGDATSFVLDRVHKRLRNWLKRYGRWDERERTILDEVLDE